MEKKSPIIEIMPLEKFLRLSPEERIRENDLMANRWLTLECFTKELFSGWNLVQSQLVNRKS
jgi:hypothetical protein